MTKGQGDFFAIDKGAWQRACDAGLNPAVAYLVMGRGTGPDNATTMWSADAVFRHSGIAWRRAHAAINVLMERGLVVRSREGKRPRYKLTLPKDKDDFIWLPNALITGAAGEVPPVAKLRQTQEVTFLHAFVGLYGLQDLTGDGGLPRSLLWHPMESRERICGYGPFDVVGFVKGTSKFCHRVGPLSKFRGNAKDKGDAPVAWDFLSLLERMGLLEWVIYLADGKDSESELIHPLTGDEYAEAVADAAATFASELPGGFKHEVDNYDFVLPIPSHMANATLVGVARLRYRPRTSRTAAWYAQHVHSCRDHETVYRRLASGEFTPANMAAGGLR